MEHADHIPPRAHEPPTWSAFVRSNYSSDSHEITDQGMHSLKIFYMGEMFLIGDRKLARAESDGNWQITSLIEGQAHGERSERQEEWYWVRRVHDVEDAEAEGWVAWQDVDLVDRITQGCTIQPYVGYGVGELSPFSNTIVDIHAFLPPMAEMVEARVCVRIGERAGFLPTRCIRVLPMVADVGDEDQEQEDFTTTSIQSLHCRLVGFKDCLADVQTEHDYFLKLQSKLEISCPTADGDGDSHANARWSLTKIKNILPWTFEDNDGQHVVTSKPEGPFVVVGYHSDALDLSTIPAADATILQEKINESLAFAQQFAHAALGQSQTAQPALSSSSVSKWLTRFFLLLLLLLTICMVAPFLQSLVLYMPSLNVPQQPQILTTTSIFLHPAAKPTNPPNITYEIVVNSEHAANLNIPQILLQSSVLAYVTADLVDTTASAPAPTAVTFKGVYMMAVPVPRYKRMADHVKRRNESERSAPIPEPAVLEARDSDISMPFASTLVEAASEVDAAVPPAAYQPGNEFHISMLPSNLSLITNPAFAGRGTHTIVTDVDVGDGFLLQT